MKKSLNQIISESLRVAIFRQEMKEFLKAGFQGEFINEGIFSSLGNKVAAGVGMRGKEKDELASLEYAYQQYKEKSGEENKALNLNSLYNVLTYNLAKTPRSEFNESQWNKWLGAFSNDAGGFSNGNQVALQNLARKLGMNTEGIDSLKAQLNHAALSAPKWVDATWGRSVQGIIKNIQENILLKLESRYQEKIKELKEKLGRA